MLPLDSSHSSDLQTPLTFHFMKKETGDMTAQSLLFAIYFESKNIGGDF